MCGSVISLTGLSGVPDPWFVYLWRGGRVSDDLNKSERLTFDNRNETERRDVFGVSFGYERRTRTKTGAGCGHEGDTGTYRTVHGKETPLTYYISKVTVTGDTQ